MINFTKFKEILISYVKLKKTFPDVTFKYATSLNNIVTKLAGSATFYSAKLGLSSGVSKMIDDVSERLTSDPLTQQAFSELTEISENFINNIKSSIDVLSTVKNVATSLESEINKTYQNIAQRSTVLSKVENVQQTDETFDKIDWSDYLLVGPEASTVTRVHEELKISESEASRLYFNRLTVALGNVGSITKIESDKETIDKIVEQLVAKLPEVLNDDIRKALGIVIDPMKFSTLAGKLSKALNLKGKVTNNVIDMMWYMRILVPVLDQLDSGNIEGISGETLNTIKANIQKIDTVLRMAAYFVITVRRSIVNNAIMLDNKMLNPDNLSKFKEQGGTIENIVNHLTYLYPSNNIPFTGITIDNIFSMRDNFSVRAEKELSQLAVKVKYEKNKALKSAMQMVLRNYLKENKEALKYKYNTESLVVRFSEHQIVNDPPVIDSLYHFVIDTQYPNTFVKKLMNNLGNAYVQRLANSTDIKEGDTQLVEASVYTDIVISFIIDNFLVNLGVIEEPKAE